MGLSRVGTALLVGSMLAVPSLGAQEAHDPCTWTTDHEFTYGISEGWEVDTRANADGTEAWHVTDDPMFDGWVAETEAHGTGAKDDRLVSAPVVPTADGAARLIHNWALGAGDGAFVEVSRDGGSTWEAVPAQSITGYGYDGVTSGGAPAWTGARPQTYVDNPTVSWIDLGSFAGEEIRLAFRLLQDGVTPVPGHRWTISRVSLFDVADPGCRDGHTAEPWRRCLAHHQPVLDDGPPAGWAIQTPVNEDGTATWSSAGDLFFINGGVATAASGRGAKDDRLVSASFLPSPMTEVWFRNGFFLEPGRDGGVLEVSDDGGSSWTVLEPQRYTSGAPSASLADGTPAWTGTSLIGRDPMPTVGHEPTRPVAVRLGDLAGERVQLRWRLLQDAARPDSLPGEHWAIDNIEFRNVLDDACLDGGHATERPIDAGSWWNCTDLTTDHAGIAGVTDDGSNIDLAVRILLDTEEIATIRRLLDDPATAAEGKRQFDELVVRAAELVAPVARAYDPLGIDLTFTYDLLMPLLPDGTARVRTSDIDEMIGLAKTQYGGRRPAGTDAVYVLTDREASSGGSESVAGKADCVGGIRSADTAFAAGEWIDNDSLGITGPLAFSPDTGAKVVAHELGHLLGAHHHYAECVTGVASEPLGDVLSTCTLMINDVGLASLHFSHANGAVARGFADEHAR